MVDYNLWARWVYPGPVVLVADGEHEGTTAVVADEAVDGVDETRPEEEAVAAAAADGARLVEFVWGVLRGEIEPYVDPDELEAAWWAGVSLHRSTIASPTLMNARWPPAAPLLLSGFSSEPERQHEGESSPIAGVHR